MHPPENGERRHSPERAPLDPRSAEPQIPQSIAHTANAERQARARARIAAQDRRHRICRELERLAPVRTYYGSRELVDLPVVALWDRRGRWVA